MKAKILSLLRERGDYVSGQELCEKYGVSRTAIWKAIGQLKKEGYYIEAVRNKGYLLLEQNAPEGEEMYGQNELSSRMRTRWVGHPVYYFDTIGSTNAQAKKLGEEGGKHGTLIVADMQTAGRGRRGRVWDSPAGTNIYYTLLLRPDITPDQASMLTLVMAMAVTKGIQSTLPKHADAIGIKWPNDIVVDGKKVCGILTEMSLSVEQDSIQYVVIGVGINVKPQQFAPELADRATALCDAFKQDISRTELLTNICASFEECYETFVKEGNLTGLQRSYDALLVNRNREVCVLDPAGEYRGIARGIDERGRLLVELADGTRTEVYAGEVSVRGIYGYV
ncbi:MAG: biotin--[Lachnospiraceae bacterium]|nr:biotin--[acetyl-CoA-carboxylase] ligase [Lachnospiraceae bacterium]